MGNFINDVLSLFQRTQYPLKIWITVSTTLFFSNLCLAAEVCVSVGPKEQICFFFDEPYVHPSNSRMNNSNWDYVYYVDSAGVRTLVYKNHIAGISANVAHSAVPPRVTIIPPHAVEGETHKAGVLVTGGSSSRPETKWIDRNGYANTIVPALKNIASWRVGKYLYRGLSHPNVEYSILVLADGPNLTGNGQAFITVVTNDVHMGRRPNRGFKPFKFKGTSNLLKNSLTSKVDRAEETRRISGTKGVEDIDIKSYLDSVFTAKEKSDAELAAFSKSVKSYSDDGENVQVNMAKKALEAAKVEHEKASGLYKKAVFNLQTRAQAFALKHNRPYARYLSSSFISLGDLVESIELEIKLNPDVIIDLIYEPEHSSRDFLEVFNITDYLPLTHNLMVSSSGAEIYLSDMTTSGEEVSSQLLTPVRSCNRMLSE